MVVLVNKILNSVNKILNYIVLAVNKARFIPLLFVCMCVTACASENKKSMVIDDRVWEIGANNSTLQSTFEEYVIKGEDINNWSELFTIQYYPKMNQKMSLETYVSAFKDSLNNSCPGAVTWKDHERSENEIISSFAVNNCKNEKNQSETVRFISTNRGIHAFHYATRKSPMTDSDEKSGIHFLKRMVIQYKD